MSMEEIQARMQILDKRFNELKESISSVEKELEQLRSQYSILSICGGSAQEETGLRIKTIRKTQENRRQDCRAAP
jgi:chromosome segregation ATPase